MWAHLGFHHGVCATRPSSLLRHSPVYGCLLRRPRHVGNGVATADLEANGPWLIAATQQDTLPHGDLPHVTRYRRVEAGAESFGAD